MVGEKQRGFALVICFLFLITPLFANRVDSTQVLETRPFGYLVKLNDQSLVFNDPKTQELTALFFGEGHFKVEYVFQNAVSDTAVYSFVLNGQRLNLHWLSARRVIIYHDKPHISGEVYILKNEKEKDRFRFRKVKVKSIPLTFVQTQQGNLNSSDLETRLNELVKPYFITFDVRLIRFEHDGFQAKMRLNNPSPARLRYTQQMIHLRDLLLQEEGKKLDNQLVFVGVKGFVNKDLKQYMVQNKALGFVELDSIEKLAESIMEGLMEGFFNSNYKKLVLNSDIHRYDIYSFPSIYSLMDEYEEVKTNNGLIAYYFYQVNSKNELIIDKSGFLASVNRPIKKNTYSYHLQIDNFFFKYLFRIKGFGFNFLHLLGFLLISISWFFIGNRFRKFFKAKFRWSVIFRILSWLFQLITLPLLCWLLFILVNTGYGWFEVQNGQIKEFDNLSIDQVLDRLMLNVNPTKNEEPKQGSEIILKKGNSYELLQRKQVLYFETKINKQGESTKLVASSDSLVLPFLNWKSKAYSHYFVHTTITDDGRIKTQQVFNHLGVDLTDKLSLDDPPKRILVFVNGYRPTSLGVTFEENFKDIEQNGIEFPNSLNRLFPNDRYNYWHPWNSIDDKFKAKINPSEIFYADGHHSVATSNHRSIIRFTTNSNAYPKRCKNLKKHTCYKTRTLASKYFGSTQKSTYKLLATKANKKGFNIRKNSGRIAGRNLYQLLNELPNTSKNDTLYIVAHSMGFAYAQGMVDHLRGKINFGGYYILAPENAVSGKVKVSEWKQVWQYGSNLNATKPDAPCLQDGVAPQTLAGGLNKNQQIFIPKSENRHKGYFDSHFVGYYNWIFKLKSKNNGYIKQL